MILALALIAAAISAWAAPVPPQSFEREIDAMGTRLNFKLEAENREHALSASNRAVEAVLRAERRLSTWLEDSELSRLNRAAPGREIPLSPELERDLDMAFSCAKRTGGRFDPSIGPLIAAWNLKGKGKTPTSRELEGALKDSGPAHFRLNPGTALRSRAGARIEEGGFGKGVALDDAIEVLKASGVRVATLNFGGQVSVLGRQQSEVSIANPAQRDQVLLALSASEGSVSTSGNSEHGLKVGRRKVGHILDPRTGRPAPFNGSVTVVAPTAAEADCLSTGLFVMGPRRGLEFIRKAGAELQAVFLSPSESGWVAQASCGLRGRIRALNPEVRMTYDCRETNKGESP